MAGEYAALTLDSALMKGTQADGLTLKDRGSLLTAAKAQFRRDAYPVVGTFIGSVGTDETTFYDAIAALATTEEVRVELDTLLVWEVYKAYWHDRAGRPGLKGTPEAKHQQYQALIKTALPRFLGMVRTAYDNGELTFTGADRVANNHAVLPFI